MAFKIVFTPHPVLAFEARRRERFVGSTFSSRKDAERTLEYLQERGPKTGIYKIVPTDYQLKDV